MVAATPIEVYRAFRYALFVGAEHVPIAGARREPRGELVLWRAMQVDAKESLGELLWQARGEPVHLILYSQPRTVEGARCWRLRWERVEDLEFDLRADADRPAHEGACLHGVTCTREDVPEYVEALERLRNSWQYGGRETDDLVGSDYNTNRTLERADHTHAYAPATPGKFGSREDED